MKSVKLLYILLFFSILILSSKASASGAGITYHGRLIDPSGNPVVSSNVQFRIQIRTPGNENCLMYEEIQNKDLSESDGIFSVTINDGTGSRVDSSGYGIDRIFGNTGSFSLAAGTCAIGSNYSPNSTDGRRIQVYFNDGTFANGQWEPMPSMAINFVPMAIESLQVGGYKKEQLIKLADGVTTTGSELDSTKWTNLLALINGTSTAYSKPTDQVTQLYGASIPAPVTGQSIRWNAALNAGSGGWENFTPGASVAVTNVTAGTGLNVGAGPGGSITTSGTLNIDVGTTSGKIVQMAAGNKLPAVDGSNLTSVNAASVGGITVSLAALASGQVLKYNGTNWVNSTLIDNDTLGGLSCASGRVAYFSGSWNCLEVTSANTINTIVSRDGTGASSFGVVNTGALQINDGSSGNISLLTPATVTSYMMRLPTSTGTNGYVLTTDGGNPAQLSWTAISSNPGTVTTVSSANSDISVATNSSTPVLTLNSGSTGGVSEANKIAKLDTSGLLALAMIPGLNTSQLTAGTMPIVRGGTNSSTVLTNNQIMYSNSGAIKELGIMSDGQIIVGKTSNAPQVVTMSSDAIISNTGSVTVTKIQNRSVASTAPSLGSFMKWNNTFSQWEPSVLASCLGADQVMHYNSTTDTWTCDYITFNSLAPSQTGNIGKVLTTDGTNTSWSSMTSSQWTTSGSDIHYSSGNVGIGTSNIIRPLTLKNTTANSTILIDRTLATTSSQIAYSTNYLGGSAPTPATPIWFTGIQDSGTVSGTQNNYSINRHDGTSMITSLTINPSGNVGIGISSPRSVLDVNGTLLTKAATLNASGIIDFATGNIQYTNSSCGAFQFNNIKDGGSFTFIVKGTTSATCSFTAFSDNGSTPITVHMPPDHANTTASKHTVYSLMVAGTDVYVAWIPSY